jgi:tRNA pseudouridine55 synthase
MTSSPTPRPAPCGLLLFDKPAGWTSRQVVDHVQRLVRPGRAGHAGTLDPLATGVLLVCVGRATRLVSFLHELPKAYRVEFQFGLRSDTDDTEGVVIPIPGAPPVSRTDLEAVLPRFRGTISQVPPAYSAVRVQGRRAYELARRGESPELRPREVQIFSLDLVTWEPSRCVFDVVCSAGTYIRSLGRDMAAALGTGAIMSSLIRTRIGPFLVSDAIAPDQLTPAMLQDRLLPPARAVAHLPSVVSDDAAIRRLAQGQAVPCTTGGFADGDRCAVCTAGGELLGIATYREGTQSLHPRVMLV